MKSFFGDILHYFDKLEDRVRHLLSKYPIIYATIGGTAIVLFWRGVWEISEMYFGPIMSVAISAVIMLLTGTFVSFFIGEQLILSGIKKEQRIDQKTEEDLRKEEEQIHNMRHDINEIKKDIAEIKKFLSILTSSNK